MNKKALSQPILISMVVGNMIGTGIYLLPASLAEYGTISVISWIYTSLGAMLLALTFANLNKLFPKTGGPYIYCREAFGTLIGFIVAYTYWISNLVSIAGIAVASIGYLGFLSPMLDAQSASYHPGLALLFELAAVWLFTIINVLGIHTAGLVQLFLTIIKILPLLLVSFVGLGYIDLQNLAEFNISNTSHLTAISAGAALCFWSFIGLECATVPAENTEGTKSVFIATVFGTLITCLIYIFSTIVLMGMIAPDQLQSSQFPFAQAGTMLFGPSAAFIIAIFAVISGLGALNVCVLVQGQIVFAAARDGFFPKRFAKLSKHDVPIAGQLLSSSLISIFLFMTMQPSLLAQFNAIILLAALLTLFVYFMTTLASIKCQLQNRKTKSIDKRYFAVACLAAFYALWMISSIGMFTLAVGLIMVALCVPIYFLFIKKQYTQNHV